MGYSWLLVSIIHGNQMTKIFIGLIFLFTTAIGFAQETIPRKKRVSHRKQNHILAEEQINQLKEGALLIRLKTKSNSILALRKMGKDKLADKVAQKQADYNLNIVIAFKTTFNFCPTYFFFSDYSKEVREKRFDQVVFLNNNLLADSTIKFDNKYFLTAEFGTIEQDTAKYFSHYSYEPDSSLSLKRVSNYYGGPDLGFGALIIKSDKFIQL